MDRNNRNFLNAGCSARPSLIAGKGIRRSTFRARYSLPVIMVCEPADDPKTLRPDRQLAALPGKARSARRDRFPALCQRTRTDARTPTRRKYLQSKQNSPPGPKPNHQQNSANEIGNKRAQKRSMRPNSDRTRKVRHELCPVRRLLLPSMPQEQRCPRPHAQESDPHLRPFRHERHTQNIPYVSHREPPLNTMMLGPGMSLTSFGYIPTYALTWSQRKSRSILR